MGRPKSTNKKDIPRQVNLTEAQDTAFRALKEARSADVGEDLSDPALLRWALARGCEVYGIEWPGTMKTVAKKRGGRGK